MKILMRLRATYSAMQLSEKTKSILNNEHFNSPETRLLA